MDKDNKKSTANTPKRLTIKHLKEILGGLDSNAAAIVVEDWRTIKESPNAE